MGQVGGRLDVQNLSPNNVWVYGILYFILVVFFTYFYTAFQFRPDQTADYLRKNGGFIPGIRPGKPTSGLPHPRARPHHLGRRVLPGLIAVLAVLRDDADGRAGADAQRYRPAHRRGVVLDTMKQLEAQLMMRNYSGFIR